MCPGLEPGAIGLINGTADWRLPLESETATGWDPLTPMAATQTGPSAVCPPGYGFGAGAPADGAHLSGGKRAHAEAYAAGADRGALQYMPAIDADGVKTEGEHSAMNVEAAQGGGEMSGGSEDLPPSDLLDAFISGLAEHSSPLH